MKNGLPKGWKIKTINEAAIIRPKKSEVKDLDDNMPISFVPMAFLNENNIEFRHQTEKSLKDVYKGYTYFRDGDVLLAKVTPCFENGKAGIAKGLTNSIGFGSSEFHIIRPKEGIIAEWLYYTFLTDKFKAEGKRSFTGSSGLKRVPTAFIQKYSIPLPPLPEQQRIVNKLDALFAQINEAIQLVEANLDLIPYLKMALLDKAFKGQLSGDVKLGKNDLPKGWELTTIDKAATIRPKKSEVKEIDDETPISFVPMAFLNANNIQFNHQTEKPLKDVYKGYTYFKDGDVLLAKVTPCFENGKAGIAKGLTNSIGFGSSEFHIIRPKEGILAEWIYYTFLTSKFKAEGKRSFTGSSGLKRVPHAFIQKYKIPLPPIKEQKNVINTLDQVFDKLGSFKTENQSKKKHLQDLKKSLLEQAFQGKL